MLRQYELVERVLAYDPDADEAMLNRAYVYTVQKHGTQKRASGDPYFSHPVEVAGLMTELKLDQETIITALLHDTIEDTLATVEEVEKLFGPEVARLVDGVTKLSKIEAMGETERAAENLRKFFLAMSDDIRVLLVKLADRLHNMRTLHFIKSEDKRQRIARETMDIYAPLAERVGMYEYMREMQLLAFEQLEPEAYGIITGRLTQIRETDHGQVDAIALSIKQALAESGLKVEVSGREKHPYMIWKKMAERHVSFEQITDIMAFRVLTDSVADCYRALGILHSNWLIKFRRMVGLYAFFYGSLHFLVYAIADRFAGLDFPDGIVSLTTVRNLAASVGADIYKRPFITIGFTTLMLLLPLAITSTTGWIRRMGGKRWAALHRLVYATGVTAVVHYYWLVKADISRPLIYAAVVTLLLGLRVYWARMKAASAVRRV